MPRRWQAVRRAVHEWAWLPLVVTLVLAVCLGLCALTAHAAGKHEKATIDGVTALSATVESRYT